MVFQLVSIPPSRRLPLGADEEHAPAGRDRVAHRLEGAVEHRDRLGEVDDVDVVSRAEDVRRHLGIPAVALVAEMGASFEELTHGEVGKRQGFLSG
jgi:hypothetical protein